MTGLKVKLERISLEKYLLEQNIDEGKNSASIRRRGNENDILEY